MSYILDTDICIYWLRGREEIKQKIQEVGEENLGITAITLAELRYGAYCSAKADQNLKAIDNFVKKVRVLTLNNESADRFGKMKTDLRRKGELIDDFDILNASIALTQGAIFVTNNVDHFRRIPELKIENWLR